MNTCLRLLLVGPLPPPSGGMANQTRQLMRLLHAEGLAVSLVRTNAPYRPAWLGSLRGVRAVGRFVPYVWRLWREAGRVDAVHVMANSGWAWHLFAAPAIRVARIRAKPVIVNYRGGLAREFLEKSASRVKETLRGTRLVVPSSFLRDVFARYGIAAEIIPNIVDTTVFRPANDRSAVRDPTAPHIVIARNLETIYGIDLGLRALAMLLPKMPGIRATIAGSGPEQARLETLAASLGLGDRVRFTGRLEVPQMVELYRGADVVLNPVRADNTPNSILEALACGVPVVSTNVGGVPHLVEHARTAWLVDPESPEALARGLAEVLGDAELRRGLTERGLDVARACAWTAVKHQWLRAYGEIRN